MIIKPQPSEELVVWEPSAEPQRLEEIEAEKTPVEKVTDTLQAAVVSTEANNWWLAAIPLVAIIFPVIILVIENLFKKER